MTTALLDNVIWNALTTEQRHLAELDGDAARFAPAVTLLAGVRAPTPGAFDALGRLLGDGAHAGLFLDASVPIPASIEVLGAAGIVQLVQPAPVPTHSDDDLVELGAADVAAMIELAELARPGPFGPRTRELGTFLGIRDGDRLVAMAGQRMRLPGMIEISAVCTHPDHLGRGHAARLLAVQASRIHAAGATPFLHVRDDNARAIALYERVGFRERRRFRYSIVRAVA